MQMKDAQAQRHEHSPKRELSVKKQIVAGFVIFRRTTEGIKFLLLYRRGSYWNFPKGHFEAGENSLDTALRETAEETGIRKEDLRISPIFRAQERFSFHADNQRIYDTLILYLAETRKAQVTIIPREHSGYAWFTYSDAIKTIGKKYVGTARVLRQAYDFIRRVNVHRQATPQHSRQAPLHRPPVKLERKNGV